MWNFGGKAESQSQDEPIDYTADLNINVDFNEEDLNNPQLLAELASLTMDDRPKPVPKPKKPVQQPKIEVDQILATIPSADTDEVHVELTEDDMNDPNLLAQLAQLGGVSNEALSQPNVVEPSEHLINKIEPLEQEPETDAQIPTPQTASSTEINEEMRSRELKLKLTNVETLKKHIRTEKQNAVVKKRAGDKTAALDHLQFAKALEERVTELESVASPTKPLASSPVAPKVNPVDQFGSLLEERLVEYKKAALVYKKSDRLELAREMLSRAKLIQTELTNRASGQGNVEFVIPPSPTIIPETKAKSATKQSSPSPSATTVVKNPTSIGVNTTDSIKMDAPAEVMSPSSTAELIGHLTETLEKQIATCTKLSAQYFTANEKDKALEFHKRKKGMIQDRETLRTLKNVQMDPNAMPFTFQYTNLEYTIAQTHQDVPLDELNIQIKTGKDFIVKGVSDIETLVVYDVGWPFNAEGTLPLGKGETIVVQGADPNFEFSKNVKIERTKAFQRFLERKKATFEVYYLSKSMFGMMVKRISLGKATVKLDCFLSKREFHEMVPLMDPTNPRRATGAVLEIHLRLRAPLIKADIVTINEKWLNIVFGQSAPPVSIPASAKVESPVPKLENTGDKVAKPINQSKASLNTPKSPAVSSHSLEKAGDEEVAALESDFANPDLITSNQVLEHEHGLLTQQIASGKIKGPELDDLVHQKQGYEIKMQMLVTSIQLGTLTLPAYLSQVKESIKTTKEQALKFKKYGQLDLAKKALVRVKLMTAEVEEAEASM